MEKHHPKHHKHNQTHTKGPPHTPKNAPSLYGFHAVREAWLNPERKIDLLYLTTQSRPGFEKTLQEAKEKGLKRPSPTEIDKQKFDRLVPQGAVHQGLALVCASLAELDERDLLIRLENKPNSVIAILDQVTDPHNVGAILRSASAFGLDGVIMQKKHAPTLDGVLAKTACGAVEHIPVAQATNLSRAIEELKEAGFFIIGLDERGPEILTSGHTGRICVVLGSEGEGIRRLIKESCDSLVRLPTGGAIASLNVSNAAAVSFFALKSTKK